MIAAGLGLELFQANESDRFFRLLRVPPGQSTASLALDRILLAASQDRRDAALALPRDNGWTVLLAGQLHNRRELGVTLGLPGAPAEAVYAAALARWGDAADEYCIGHYAAIALAPDRKALRLARSPFQAPPLHFRHDGAFATVAQRPSMLFWREDRRPEPDLTRVGQTLLNDASDRYRSWYVGAARVPLGCAISLRPEQWHEVWRYDLFSRPRQRLKRPEDYVAAALALLDQGVAAVLDGVSKPAILLSGGLDSPLVAASALRQRAGDGPIHAYTFGPASAAIARSPEGVFHSDFDLVTAFAKANPGLTVRFETNPGRDFRYMQRELLEASDAAPSMLGLAWIEQALYAAARAEGCDAMLCGTWGNFTFSSRGPWAFSEYFLHGRWRQLRRALQCRIGDPRPAWRQFLGLSVAPLLPRGLWQVGHRIIDRNRGPFIATAIRRDWPQLDATLDRSRRAGYDFERLQFASQRDHWRALLAEDGQEQDQYALGMELLHGLPKRDPTAYRPLVEFCWGCPTDLFMRDGTDRWLAREMARGRLPEAQRTNRAYGHHFVDLHHRLAGAREDLLDELERMADDPDIAALIDLPRLKDLVSALPDLGDTYDPGLALPYQTTLPIGMASARFIAYAKGRNDI